MPTHPSNPASYEAWLAAVITQIVALRVTLKSPPGSLLTNEITDAIEAIECDALNLAGDIASVIRAIRELNEDDAADIAAENARPGSLARLVPGFGT